MKIRYEKMRKWQAYVKTILRVTEDTGIDGPKQKAGGGVRKNELQR